MIYVITRGVYSDYHIVAATTNADVAKTLSHRYDANIEEYTDGEELIKDSIFEYYFEWNGKLRRRYDETDGEYSFNDVSGVKKIVDGYKVLVRTTKPEQADKIAFDMLAQYKAEQEGL